MVMAAKGYPVDPVKGSEIRGVEGLDGPDLQVFHAGTLRRDGRLIANGGRVLNVTALGRTVAEARERAYAAVERDRLAGGLLPPRHRLARARPRSGTGGGLNLL